MKNQISILDHNCTEIETIELQDLRKYITDFEISELEIYSTKNDNYLTIEHNGEGWILTTENSKKLFYRFPQNAIIGKIKILGLDFIFNEN
jgi:UDP-N-acetylglucosamine transferase subunit ALG13